MGRSENRRLNEGVRAAGREARRAGVARCANPWTPWQSTLHDHWRNGWDEAQHLIEREEANRVSNQWDEAMGVLRLQACLADGVFSPALEAIADLLQQLRDAQG